ncbi:unnamed protein product, partial [Rotaria magnacalcarata]
MKRKRAHDDKLILKHGKKDQSLPEINNDSDDDDQRKTLEVDNMTITIQDPNG